MKKHFFLFLLAPLAFFFASCASSQRPGAVQNAQIKVHEAGVWVEPTKKATGPFAFSLKFFTGPAAPAKSYVTVSFPTVGGKALPPVKIDNVTRGADQSVRSATFSRITNRTDYPITIQLFVDEARTLNIETVTQKVRCSIPDEEVQKYGLQGNMQ